MARQLSTSVVGVLRGVDSSESRLGVVELAQELNENRLDAAGAGIIFSGPHRSQFSERNDGDRPVET